MTVYHQAYHASRAGKMFALWLCLRRAGTCAGCADKRGGPIPYSPSNFGAPDAPTVAPLGSGYKIAPLDTLTIKVFKMPDLSGDFEVDLTGQISIPLIGSLTATDFTTAQLDEQLTRSWARNISKIPTSASGSNRRPAAA